MPKKSTKKSSSITSRPWLKYALPVLVVLTTATAGYLLINKGSDNPQTSSPVSSGDTKIDYTPATKADNQPSNDRKNSSNPSTTLNNYQPPANTGAYSVTITRAGLDSAKQNLQVAAITHGVTSGTCILNVHQQGQASISKSEPLSLEVNSYACPVISVPVSDFPNTDAWEVSMTVEANGQTVTSDWVQNPVQLH